jgi:hypothetical protein
MTAPRKPLAPPEPSSVQLFPAPCRVIGLPPPGEPDEERRALALAARIVNLPAMLPSLGHLPGSA